MEDGRRLDSRKSVITHPFVDRTLMASCGSKHFFVTVVLLDGLKLLLETIGLAA